MAHKQIRGNAKIGQRKSARVKSYGLRERAWWLIRRLGTFTVETLLNTIALGTEKTAYKSVSRYVNALTRAHVLTSQPTPPKPGDGGNGPYRYQLVRDLGMEAPVWRMATDEVYDPNSKTVLACDPKPRSPQGGSPASLRADSASQPRKAVEEEEPDA